MIRADVKREFAKQFTLKKFEVKWFDLAGLILIDGQRVAKMVITERGQCDHFDAIRLTISNRVTGEIDCHDFVFNDYLSFDAKDRTDGRSDYTNGFHVWRNGTTFDWYIAKPKTLVPLLKAIEDYLTAWK